MIGVAATSSAIHLSDGAAGIIVPWAEVPALLEAIRLKQASAGADAHLAQHASLGNRIGVAREKTAGPGMVEIEY